ncbi:hypothetical protein JB92DRAFT_2834623 [Gautieria morchelliformis]|nr:hypothetical protein JB92DRAFT_2834623 [Gautieria morchelliformis]
MLLPLLLADLRIALLAYPPRLLQHHPHSGTAPSSAPAPAPHIPPAPAPPAPFTWSWCCSCPVCPAHAQRHCHSHPKTFQLAGVVVDGLTDDMLRAEQRMSVQGTGTAESLIMAHRITLTI